MANLQLAEVNHQRNVRHKLHWWAHSPHLTEDSKYSHKYHFHTMNIHFSDAFFLKPGSAWKHRTSFLFPPPVGSSRSSTSSIKASSISTNPPAGPPSVPGLALNSGTASPLRGIWPFLRRSCRSAKRWQRRKIPRKVRSQLQQPPKWTDLYKLRMDYRI